jgi:hypothetical protein
MLSLHPPRVNGETPSRIALRARERARERECPPARIKMLGHSPESIATRQVSTTNVRMKAPAYPLTGRFTRTSTFTPRQLRRQKLLSTYALQQPDEDTVALHR